MACIQFAQSAQLVYSLPKLTLHCKMSAAADEAEDLAKKEVLATKLVLNEFIFITAVAMVIPTRAPMVLEIKKGDAVGTARVLGTMSSLAAAIELFINPVFGQLSDMYGRKPFLLFAPFVDAFLHTAVAIFPKTLEVTFVDRMITGSMIFAFKAPLSAALVDLFGTGPKLAQWLARQGSAFGLGLGLGPFVGAKIGGAASFFWSSVMFVVSLLWTAINVPETLALKDRKKFNVAACVPWRFLKLFQGRTLSTLAVTIGMQSFGDYLNVYDINYLFLKSVFNVGPTEIGQYASACGITQFFSGSVMSNAIKTMGQQTATLGANAMWAVSMGLLGTATSVQQVIASLLCMTFGHTRNAAVAAYIQKHGQGIGMGKAEITAAQGNLLAVLKVFIPLFYGNLFAMATSNGRKMPGMPYFFIAFITMLSQLCFMTCDPEKESVKPK